MKTRSELMVSTEGRARLPWRRDLRCFLVRRSRLFQPWARSFLRSAEDFPSVSTRVHVVVPLGVTGVEDDEEGGVFSCWGSVGVPVDG